MSQRKHPALQWPLTLASLMFCACAFAQTPTAANPYPMPPRNVQNQPPPPNAAPKPAPKPPAKPAKPSPAIDAKPPVPAAAPSLLNQPPQPAKVSLVSGKLTVEAHNSSLSSILAQVAKAGGMKLNGFRSDERIFGKYGPGAPREVLTELLDGSGYNILMVGKTPAGTPRELALSPRAGGVPNPPPQSAAQDEDTEDEPQPTQYTNEQENQPQPPPPNVRNRVRTPEQILQELQRMRQQQQQPH